MTLQHIEVSRPVKETVSMMVEVPINVPEYANENANGVWAWKADDFYWAMIYTYDRTWELSFHPEPLADFIYGEPDDAYNEIVSMITRINAYLDELYSPMTAEDVEIDIEHGMGDLPSRIDVLKVAVKDDISMLEACINDVKETMKELG